MKTGIGYDILNMSFLSKVVVRTVYIILFFLVGLGASTIGAIAGIGGGVIIKPALDSFKLLSVSAISFLSGCTVLCMSLYSVMNIARSGENHLQVKISVPLGIGAAFGGIAGNALFKYIRGIFSDPNTVGAVQAACLAVVTLITLVYTLRSGRIRTHSLKNAPLIMFIGLCLGITSSFLGIGGGPINLMVLSFFFSMDVKSAAQNSLLVILLSQISSLTVTLITHNVPEVSALILALMAGGGILGGIIGRKLNKRMTANQVRTLLCATMAAIILICLRNIILYLP